MYLDKSLKDHTLLQAICRTNRLYPGKTFGRIVVLMIPTSYRLVRTQQTCTTWSSYQSSSQPDYPARTSVFSSS